MKNLIKEYEVFKTEGDMYTLNHKTLLSNF